MWLAASATSACSQFSPPVWPPGQDVVRAAAHRDLQAPVAPRAGGELDQAGGVRVQDAELQRAVSFRPERSGADAAGSEPDAAAQPLARDVRAVPEAGGDGCGQRILLAQT
jgi:hypothetical protein